MNRARDDLFNVESIHGRATMSPCGRYRYTLERSWSSLPRYVLWLMLNPSTADARENDATIRRCLGYARAWGYTGILVGNLYALRSTSPRMLDQVAVSGGDPIGPDNLASVRALVARASLIVCAWGRAGPVQSARFNVLQLLRPPQTPHILRMNAGDGLDPSHPLRLAADLKPRAWDVFAPMSPGHGP
jgi:hypothetical protein